MDKSMMYGWLDGCIDRQMDKLMDDEQMDGLIKKLQMNKQIKDG